MKNLLFFFILICCSSSTLLAQESAIEQLIENQELDAAWSQIQKEKETAIQYSPNYFQLQEYTCQYYWALWKLEKVKQITDESVNYLTSNGLEYDTLMINPLANYAGLAYTDGDFKTASEEFERCLVILEKNGLVNSLNYAQVCSNLGLFYSYQNRLKESLEKLKIAESYFKRTNDNENLFLVYGNLANTYHSLYQYKKASDYYLLSLKGISKKEAPLDYARSGIGYSTLLYDQGLYKNAQKENLRLLTILKDANQTESIEYSKVLNNFGVVYQALGDYSNAEKTLYQALTLQKQLLGSTHPDVLQTTNNWAMLILEQGRYQEAEKLMKSLIISTKNSTENQSNNYLLFQNNLAIVYGREGYWKKAKSSYKEIGKYFQKTLNLPEEEASFRLNYSQLLIQRRKWKEAKTQLELINSKLLIDKDQIAWLNNSAITAMNLKDFSAATKQLDKAISLAEKLYGTTHVDYALILANQAFCYMLQEKHQLAEEKLFEALRIYQQSIKTSFPTLTEHEKELYLASLAIYNSYYYWIVNTHFSEDAEVLKQCFDLHLFYNSLALRTTALFENQVIKSENNVAKKQLKEILILKREIAKYSSLPKKEQRKSEYPLTEKMKELHRLEKLFYLKYGNSFGGFNVDEDWLSVKNNLKEKEAVVQFIRIQSLSGEISYSALILKKELDSPIWVKLKGKEKLEKGYFQHYFSAINHKQTDEKSYARYWKPIANHLKDIKRAFISNDGIFHKMNLATIYHPETKKYLIDELEFVYLLKHGKLMHQNNPNNEIYLFGNPSFYLDLQQTTKDLENHKKPTTRTVATDFEEWQELPGTKKEIEAIAEIMDSSEWKVINYTEEFALENYVKALHSPKILHIATHGWYEFKKDSIENFSENYFTNLLNQCGLIFSGGGLHLTPKDVTSNLFEDGILTANEVRFLDLSGTNLVVLSACQSGLGDIRNQEGVYGLQRSFALAGVEKMLLSLWEVDDYATKDLMIAFYQNLSKNLTIRESFNKAMLVIKTKHKYPIYWGAFVLIE